jgi:hypothetical protein
LTVAGQHRLTDTDAHDRRGVAAFGAVQDDRVTFGQRVEQEKRRSHEA